MAQILDTQGLQHYANKMCNADNRKVGAKRLPAVLNEIDTAIDGFKHAFEQEYGSPVNMEIVNNKNMFTVGTGVNIDKKDDVENSFTDVKISGNSLVNLIQEKSYLDWYVNYCGRKTTEGIFIGAGSKYANAASPNITTSTDVRCKIPSKKNTIYTLICDAKVLEGTSSEYTIVYNEICQRNTAKIKDGKNIVLIRSDESEQTGRFQIYGVAGDNGEGTINIRLSNIMILEGDYTNKFIPEYFEGLQSVGEKQDGNHKLNISSIGKNLIDIKEMKSNKNITVVHQDNKIILTSNNASKYASVEIKLTLKQVKGKTLKIYNNGVKQTNNSNGRVIQFNILKEDGSYSYLGSSNNGTIVTIPSNSKYVTFALYTNNTNLDNVSNTVEIDELMICYADMAQIPYKPHKLEQKEILLNEPLRGLPNGVKDTIEKINGEWKIVRRCGEVIFDGVVNKVTDYHASWSSGDYHSGYSTLLNNIRKKGSINGVADNIVVTTVDKILAGTTMAQNKGLWLENYSYVVYFSIPKRDTTGEGVKAINTWLANNNTKLVYELENYIIEDIDPVTLQCWKNGTITIDEVIPVETTHTVALNKSSQIQKNIEELTSLRNRVKTLEEQYSKTALNQAYETELLKLDMKLDNII